MLTTLIPLVEDAADAADCTAHVVDQWQGCLEFCCSPHDEDAGWAGELRIRSLGHHRIGVYLEHSGPWARAVFDDTDQGRRELAAWLTRELS